MPRRTDHYDFFLGTFLPFLRAFDSPIAIACLRLLTFPPLPPRPLFAVPFLKRRISLFTSLPALLEYLRFFFALRAMRDSPTKENRSLFANHLFQNANEPSSGKRSAFFPRRRPYLPE